MAQHCCGSKRKLLLSSFSRYQAIILSICALNADSFCTWEFLLGNLIKQRCDMHKYPANSFQRLDTHPSIHSFSSSRYVSSLRVRYVQSWYQRVAHCMRFCYGVPIGCNMYICSAVACSKIWSTFFSFTTLLAAFSRHFRNATDSYFKVDLTIVFGAECFHRCLSSYTCSYRVLLKPQRLQFTWLQSESLAKHVSKTALCPRYTN